MSLRDELVKGGEMRSKLTHILSGVILLLGSTGRIVHAAHSLPGFYDEMYLTTASYRFFHNLDYRALESDVPFDPPSTGIAGTWPLALVWDIGGDIFVQRLVVAFIWGLGFFTLSWRFLAKSFPWWSCFSVTSLLWSVLCCYPYWFGLLYGLGELPGALHLAFGIIILDRYPKLAVFSWGIAVWLIKFIYLPIAITWIFAYAFTLTTSRRQRRFRVATFSGIFLTPLALWWALIVLRFDMESLIRWIKIFSDFVVHGGGIVLDAREMPARWERTLDLSWAKYGWLAILRLLGLAMVPALLYVSLISKPGAIAKRHAAFIHSSMFVLLLYAIWFFGFNPAMFARHFQPALYLGFGLSMVIAFHYFGGRMRRVVLERNWTMPIGAAVVLAGSAALSWKEHQARLAEHGPVRYSQICNHPYSAACEPPLAGEEPQSVEARQSGRRRS